MSVRLNITSLHKNVNSSNKNINSQKNQNFHNFFLIPKFRTVYNNQNANTLMSALLHFVSRMVEEPATMFGINSGGSLVFGLAESLLSIFTFRKTHQDFLSSNDLPTAFKEHYPLANQSLLLILILTNHCTATTKNNKYRQSLFGCCDSKGIFQSNSSRIYKDASIKFKSRRWYYRNVFDPTV